MEVSSPLKNFPSVRVVLIVSLVTSWSMPELLRLRCMDGPW